MWYTPRNHSSNPAAPTNSQDAGSMDSSVMDDLELIKDQETAKTYLRSQVPLTFLVSQVSRPKTMQLVPKKQKARFKQSKSKQDNPMKNACLKLKWTKKSWILPWAQISKDAINRRNLLQRFLLRESRNTRESKWRHFHWVINWITGIHRFSLSFLLTFTRPC